MVTQEMIDALFEPQSSQAHTLENPDREFSRVPFRGRAAATVYPSPNDAGEKPFESEVLTTDISRGGLSLLHRRELLAGQRVLLKLKRGTCTVEVCWCCRVWTGLYVAGCRFADASFTEAVGSSDISA
jgi:hypothetical protein